MSPDHPDGGAGTGFPKVAMIGLAGFLVRFSDRHSDTANCAALAFRAALDAEDWPEVSETSTALVSVYVACDPASADIDAVAARLHQLLATKNWFSEGLPHGRRRWTIPVAFGGEHGPQLADAAKRAGVSTEAAIATFTQAPLRVLTLGFAPGQPYLGTLPEHWNLPRQTELTPTVPAGAVVVAVRQIVIFTAATPTGWRQVGRSRFPLFRPDDETPIALRAGDEVAFRAVGAAELDRLAADDPNDRGGAHVEDLA